MTLDDAIKEADKAIQEKSLGGFVQYPRVSRLALAELTIAAKEKAARQKSGADA